jgi:hypothetical protein
VLNWLHQEVTTVIGTNQYDVVSIKKPEPTVRRSNSLEFRIQAEAIVQLAAAQAGISTVDRKVNVTIAKHLGMKGKAKYLSTKLDTSPIPNFDKFTPKVRDAVLVAWSCL